MTTVSLTEPLSFPEKLLKSFWSKVEKTESCWIWIASCLQSTGRGQFPMARRYGLPSSPTRFSWIIHNGGIPLKLCVLHTCDNPLCVNPSHLFLGTLQDNVSDMVSKGRQCKGEKNGQATATEELIQSIRNFPGTHQEASDHFNVPRRRVIAYRRGDTWKHLKLAPINSNHQGEDSYTSKFTDAQILSISEASPNDSKVLSLEYGMSESLRTKIRAKKTDRIRRLLNGSI